MSITFVRHAESTANAGNKRLSQYYSTLTKKGVAQAEALRKTLPAEGLIVTSPFVRAKETTLSAFDTYTEIWPVQEFTYLPESDEASKADIEAYWERNDPLYSTAPPHTESFAQFIRRVATNLHNLEGMTATVVTHSQFIKAVYWVILTGGSTDMKAFRRFKSILGIPNTAIVRLTWDGRWHISGPDVAHLLEHERH